MIWRVKQFHVLSAEPSTRSLCRSPRPLAAELVRQPSSRFKNCPGLQCTSANLEITILLLSHTIPADRSYFPGQAIRCAWATQRWKSQNWNLFLFNAEMERAKLST